MKISVVIPAFNEEKTIRKILTCVLKQKSVGEIIVVDDGSSDKTWEVLQKIKNPKIKRIKHQVNSGKGAAIRTGFKNASLNYVLIQDADLEYNPIDYQKLLDKVSEKKVVYGTRMKTNNKHAYFRTFLGNIFITGFCNFLFGTHLTDSYTCYKLLPTKIACSLKLISNGFEIEAEITGKLAKKKIPIIEVPITYSPRSYQQGKKIKAKDALKGSLTYLKIRYGSF